MEWSEIFFCWRAFGDGRVGSAYFCGVNVGRTNWGDDTTFEISIMCKLNSMVGFNMALSKCKFCMITLM